ncbi:MAG TPA: hypothetical protein VFF43_17250, partial [Caldimonas sp.]|nr:hypothetical protein [Caldimonas sp.]
EDEHHLDAEPRTARLGAAPRDLQREHEQDGADDEAEPRVDAKQVRGSTANSSGAAMKPSAATAPVQTPAIQAATRRGIASPLTRSGRR